LYPEEESRFSDEAVDEFGTAQKRLSFSRIGQNEDSGLLPASRGASKVRDFNVNSVSRPASLSRQSMVLHSKMAAPQIRIPESAIQSKIVHGQQVQPKQ